MLVSVLIAMTLLGFCLPALIHLHMRATSMTWNAKAEQQAAAVAAWHTAQALNGGCTAVDADGDASNGYTTENIDTLAGQQLLPHDGFAVTCTTDKIHQWPPPLTTAPTTRPAAPCTSGDPCALTVTTTWARLDNTGRSLPLSILVPPS